MKKYVMPAVVAAAVMTSAPLLAADLKPVYKAAPAPVAVNPWDVAIGGAVMSDYNFRGISQSDRGTAGTAYFEGRFKPMSNVEWYAGIQAWSVKLVTEPSAEVDLYGGVRLTFDKLAFDFGVMYYYYPKEQQQFIDPTLSFVTSNPALNFAPYTLTNSDFLEVYGKASYTFNDNFSVGGAVYYTNNWLNLKASGTYGVINAKYTGTALSNGAGWFVSGEVGKYWFGTGEFYGAPLELPDYVAWNAGIAFTYKAVTLDLRYYDTNATKEECFVLTSDVHGVNNGTGQSNWCSTAFIGKLSFDTTLSALK